MIRETCNTHLVTRLVNMAASVPRPKYGEWDVPSLMMDAAEEIRRLREYALCLESHAGPFRTAISISRETTKVNWEAIHGVDP